MGSKLSTLPAVKMLVIGGCELPLEKNAYDTIESIDSFT